MSVISFFLLFTLTIGLDSNLIYTHDSSVVPVPSLLDSKILGDSWDELFDSDSVHQHRTSISIVDISSKDLHPKAIGDSNAIHEMATRSVDEKRHQAVPDPPMAFQVWRSKFHHVSFVWVPPSNDGGSPITSYTVEWSTDNGSNWSVLADNIIRKEGHAGFFRFMSSRLVPEKVFQFRVRAINIYGESDPSIVLVVTATIDRELRWAPTHITIRQTSHEEATISWRPAPNVPMFYMVTEYRLYRSDDGGDFWDLIAALDETVFSYTDSSLSAGSSYGYRLIAERNDNWLSRSSFSDATFFTMKLFIPPNAPTGLTAKAIGETTINLSWSAPSDNGSVDVSGYKIEVSPDGRSEWADLSANTRSDSRTYSHTGLTAGTTVFYRVSAINSSGTGSPSAVVSATTLPKPPLALRTTEVRRTTITLFWTAPPNQGSAPIRGYRIQSSPDTTDVSNWSDIVANTGNTETYYIDTGLSPNTKRFYRVYSINIGGESIPSNVASTTTLSISAPAAPPGLTARASGSSVILSWSAPDDGGSPITGYGITFTDQNISGGWTGIGGSIGPTATTYTHTNLEFEKTYHYAVTASNSIGSSALSDIVSARPTGTALRPDPPRSLTANPGGSSIINLSWSPPASHGGAAITAYRMQWSPDGTADSWTDLTPNTMPPATSRQHTGLDAGITRHYRVYAINSVGESAQSSNIAMATTTTGTGIAPDKPTLLRATASGQTTINLSWTAPANSGSTPLFGYRIEVSEDAGTNWEDFSRTESFLTTSDAHTGLTVGTTRHYRVYSINHEGFESEASDVVSATTGTTAATAPSAPRALRATASGQTTINLSWTAPSSTGGSSITGYRIQWSTNGTSNWQNVSPVHTGTGRTYADTGLNPGTTRHYRVYAINSIGDSPASNVDDATTASGTSTVPSAPRSLTAEADGPTTINLSWEPPSNTGSAPITGYRIEVSEDGGSNWEELVAGHRETTYSHTDVPQGIMCHYRVYAINSMGESAQASSATATTSATNSIPDPPTSLIATPSGPTIIDLSWDAPINTGGASITGYRIEVSEDGGTNWIDLETNYKETTYSHTGLAERSLCHYRVYAINSDGHESSSSDVTEATTTSGAARAVVVSFDATSSQVNESTKTITVQLNVNPPPSSSLTISYSLGGTASQNTDYSIRGPESISVATNTASVDLTIVIINDHIDESDETVIVTLTGGTGYNIGSQDIHMLTIVDDDKTDLPPLSFSTTVTNHSFDVGVPIDQVVLPDAAGGTLPYRYTLTPDPPAGIQFNPLMRTLSGTPLESMYATTYTYMVNDGDHKTVMQTFTIEVNAPQELVFENAVNDQMYPVNRAVVDLILPVAMGGLPPYSYTLTPDLPSGLTFDSQTRTLSGTPSKVTESQIYTYTVEDRTGTTSQLDLSVEVYTITFTETVANQSYLRGQAIDPLTLPEVTGGVLPIKYTLTLLDLPYDLRFDLATRTISGTPIEVSPPISLTYKAKDHNGVEDSLVFRIEIISPVHTEENSGIPQEFRGYSNYPNPFHSSTNLVFDLPWPAQVQVEVMDITGRRLITTPPVYLTAGWAHEMELNELRFPSGAYLYQIHARSLDDKFSSVYVGHLMSVK